MRRRGLPLTIWLRAAAILASGLLILLPISLLAVKSVKPPGGPIQVGGPSFGIAGAPFTWAAAGMPVQYRVDPGPLAVTSTGAVVVSNSAALSRIAAAFGNWTSVNTALISTEYAGALLATGAYTGGPVANGTSDMANFNALQQSCDNAAQSPIIFDPDGELASELGLSQDIIGFDVPCDGDSNGHFQAALVFLEGEFQSGSYNVTANEFNQAMTHEFGHFLGLDHSQINVDVLNETPLACDASEVAALPVMFPYFVCQDRVTSGLPALSPDDMAWISRLYPVTAQTPGKITTGSAYGTISGTIFFSDGVTETQGVNVIARLNSSPLSVAFSSTSGYLFTGDLGQGVTCVLGETECNSGGSASGSRDASVAGTFDIPVMPGTYTISVESISAEFTGGSGVGPLRNPPIAMPGTAPTAATVAVKAGASVIVNVTLVGTPSRFDSFETSSQSSDLIIRDLLWPWQRRNGLTAVALRR